MEMCARLIGEVVKMWGLLTNMWCISDGYMVIIQEI